MPKNKTYEILLSDLKFPEAPFFDPEGNLWFVEIKGGTLSKWNGKDLQRYPVGGTPNGAVIDQSGMIWFCDSERGEIRRFNPIDETFVTLCDSTSSGPLSRPNDLIFDSYGNLLFSDHADGRTEPLSTICVLPKGAKQAQVIQNRLFFTNGLAFRADGRTLLFAETYKQQLWISDWDSKNLVLKNVKVFSKAGEGPWGPDGIAFDEKENLYVAIFNEGLINIYDKNGSLLNHLKCSGKRPTSCCFDFHGRYGLVITEAAKGEISCFYNQKNGLKLFYA